MYKSRIPVSLYISLLGRPASSILSVAYDHKENDCSVGPSAGLPNVTLTVNSLTPSSVILIY